MHVHKGVSSGERNRRLAQPPSSPVPVISPPPRLCDASLHQKAALLLPRNRATVSTGGAPNAPVDELACLHDVVEMEIRLSAGGAGEHRGDCTPFPTID